MRKHNYNELYAGLVKWYDNTLTRASRHGTFLEAFAYAQKHSGIIAIEKIGNGIAWERIDYNYR